ncbi:MAG: 50S ribosomal protein L24 [Candidatus Kerfeldbacteria bacterium]|nr:50S ribosomal protein L24 [Candidatus Kerfeldbacteria bacterium]
MQKIKVSDTVKVLTGKDRGKTGKVTQVLPRESLIVVDGVNKRFKHLKKNKGSEKGQRIEYFAPLQVSNLAVVCPNCKKPARVGFVMEGTEKKRTCKSCKLPF